MPEAEHLFAGDFRSKYKLRKVGSSYFLTLTSILKYLEIPNKVWDKLPIWIGYKEGDNGVTILIPRVEGENKIVADLEVLEKYADEIKLVGTTRHKEGIRVSIPYKFIEKIKPQKGVAKVSLGGVAHTNLIFVVLE